MYQCAFDLLILLQTQEVCKYAIRELVFQKKTSYIFCIFLKQNESENFFAIELKFEGR